MIMPASTYRIHISNYREVPSNVIKVEYSKSITFANSAVESLPSLILVICYKIFVLGYAASRSCIYRSRHSYG